MEKLKDVMKEEENNQFQPVTYIIFAETASARGECTSRGGNKAGDGGEEEGCRGGEEASGD